MEVIEMRVITGFILLMFLASCGSIGSMHQESSTIAIPMIPLVVMKEIPAGEKVPTKMKSQESFSRPNLTKGYIENQAFPYVPRVWLLAGGEKILLVGETIDGRPQVLDWQILEFSLPPGVNQVIIERWRFLPNQGGWQMLPPEFKEFQVAKPRRGWGDYNGSGYWTDNHYDWRIIIHQNRSFIYTGGRPNWYGGRR